MNKIYAFLIEELFSERMMPEVEFLLGENTVVTQYLLNISVY